MRACCVNDAALALTRLARGCADGYAVRISSCAPPFLMSDLREQLLHFGPPFARMNSTNSDEKSDGKSDEKSDEGLPIVSWESWKSLAEQDGALSVWPLVACATTISYDSAYERDLTEGGGEYRPMLQRLLGPDVAQRLACGVEEATLHRMLSFLFGENFGSLSSV